MAEIAHRTMSIRIPEQLATELELTAAVDMMPVSVAIRTALAAHVAARRDDPDFRRRLKERLEADRLAAERFIGEEGSSDG